MLSRVFSSLGRVRVTLAYTAALFLIASVLLMLGPTVQDRVVRHLSTNLENLGQGRWGTLFGSAFVTAEGYTYLLLPGLVCLLALAELLWCSRRLIQTFALGHVGATLIVAAGLAAAIKLGWLPISVAHTQDVGLSYGAIAVIGALTAAIPVRWRPTWVAGWVTIAVVVAVSGTDFTAVGHAIALILGILLSMRFSADVRWTPARLVLLGIGVGFGLLLLVGVALPVAPVALPAGLAVATIATWAWWRWQGREQPGPLRSANRSPRQVGCRGRRSS